MIEKIPVIVRYIIIMKIKSDKIMTLTELFGNWVLLTSTSCSKYNDFVLYYRKFVVSRIFITGDFLRMRHIENHTDFYWFRSQIIYHYVIRTFVVFTSYGFDSFSFIAVSLKWNNTLVSLRKDVTNSTPNKEEFKGQRLRQNPIFSLPYLKLVI